MTSSAAQALLSISETAVSYDFGTEGMDQPNRLSVSAEPSDPALVASSPLVPDVAERIPSDNPLEEFSSSELNKVAAEQVAESVIEYPRRPMPFIRVQSLQRWEGKVTRISKKIFVARIKDLTEPESPDDLVKLDKREVSSADLPLLKVGAIFYWSVGFSTDANGQKTVASGLRFRRLPLWTESEIAKAKAASKRFERFFDIPSD